jgi:putative hydrolase of the HAD superfamily
LQQFLIIDADDTLWENNIYFIAATQQFIAFLNHSSLQPTQIYAVLDEAEHGKGYGSANFGQSLLETYHRLVERDINAEDLLQVKSFADSIARHPIELLDGVQETLAYLSSRHQLFLLTKGDEEEQKMKLGNSGLEDYFRHALVVSEKDQTTYQTVVQDFQLNPAITWMIGNSPRSDINPALAAGLNAVYIPHDHTWHLEMQDVQHSGSSKLLQLKTFAELRTHF